ncbi:MAG: hypothetical protein AB1746_00330 [Candidatus Zixiibacteriota bacterium]
MKELLGKLTASLVETGHDLPQDLISKINGNIRPPTELTADDVYIRAMYIVSDQVNSHGGRFPIDEYPRLIEMLIDSPVMIGHRKDSLPIARNFHAETIERDGVNWVKAYFYWLKKSEKGEDLQKNIDAGIYKECSISFIFNFPECSICGSDIRQCRHRPFEKYESDNGEARQAYFNYRQILKVLETSLVYRGSVRDTSITDKLFFDGASDEPVAKDKALELPGTIRRLWSLDSINKSRDCLVMPAYDAIRLNLSRDNGNIRLTNVDERNFDSEIIGRFISGLKLPDCNFEVECRLLGYCGKERKSVDEVARYLKGEKSSVRRLELKIVDLIAENGENVIDASGRDRRRRFENLFADQTAMLVPATALSGGSIAECFKRCATRCGVEIFDSDTPERFLLTNQKRVPAKITGRRQTRNGYHYTLFCNVDGVMTEISETIHSTTRWEEGNVVELEVYSIQGSRDAIELTQPKIMCASLYAERPDDIGLLLKNADEKDYNCTYSLFQSNDDVVLNLNGKTGKKTYLISRFDSALLEEGRWFFAGQMEGIPHDQANLIHHGSIISETAHGETVRIFLKGYLDGEFALRSAVLKSRKRYVFYKTNTNNNSLGQGDKK